MTLQIPHELHIGLASALRAGLPLSHLLLMVGHVAMRSLSLAVAHVNAHRHGAVLPLALGAFFLRAAVAKPALMHLARGIVSALTGVFDRLP